MMNEEIRVITLLPSATEIVCALGFESQIVGRSHECDYPAAIQPLPACTEPKFDPHGTSAQIDSRVKTILQESLSVYRVHADVLRALDPHVIVTQAHCEVCAVSYDEVERVACDFLGAEAQIVSLEPNGLADVFADMERVAAALGVPERGAALVAQLRARMAAIAQAAAAQPLKPTVATIEWIMPLMAGGNWMPTLVEMAGGINLFGEAGAHSPWMTFDDLAAADPDVIVVLPCGFDIDRTLTEMEALTTLPGWADLTAVKHGRVYITDGNSYFNRPGPRLVESLEILAEILHPSAFTFGHEGHGWRRLSNL